jgi:hypothetical protein
MPIMAEAKWKLSYQKFLGLKRALKFPARWFSVQVLFVYSNNPVTLAWLRPVLMKYEFQRLTATFEFAAGSERFLSGSYHPKAEAFVVDVKPEQIGAIVNSFPVACIRGLERAEWAEKLKAGKEVKCPEHFGFS